MNYDQISDDGHMIYPEAATMETRRAMKKEWSGARVFWFLAFTLMFLMFFGNFIISLLQ